MMKKLLFGLAASTILSLPTGTVHAQTTTTPLGDVKTIWPGIHFQVTVLKRIPPDRLLAVVQIVATPQTPPPGLELSVPNPNKPPPNMDPRTAALLFPPKPFSLESATMTDELSQQQYSTLPPVAPPGHSYRPGKVLDFLRPGDSVILTLQFPIPPPPPPPPGSTVPPKQTVSFLFPKAQGPMIHIAVPAAAGAMP